MDKGLDMIIKGGSRWVEVMADQLCAGVITEAYISDFDEKPQNTLVRWSGIVDVDK